MTTLEIILSILLVIETIILAVTVIAFFQLRRILNSATKDALSSLAGIFAEQDIFSKQVIDIPVKDQKEN